MSRKQRNKPTHHTNGKTKTKSCFKSKGHLPSKSMKKAIKATLAKEINQKQGNPAPQHTVKRTPGVAMKRQESVTSKPALSNETKHAEDTAAHKDMAKTSVVKGVEKLSTIPTTGVARKRKSSLSFTETTVGNAKEQRNGSKSNHRVPEKDKCGADIDATSNSDDEDYIDQFFHDVPDDEVDDVPDRGFDVSEDSEEGDEDEDDFEDDTDEEESDDGNEAMPFDSLVNFYGNRRDVVKNGKTASKQAKIIPNVSSTEWTVEDNDQELRYDTENEGSTGFDEEVMATASKRKEKRTTVQMTDLKKRASGKGQLSGPEMIAKLLSGDMSDDGSEEDDDFSAEDHGDSGSSDSRDEYYDLDPSDPETYSDSDMWTDASEDTYLASDGSEDSGLTYLQQPYDSESYDEDYEPTDYDEDDEGNGGRDELLIPRGMAHIYDIEDDTIPFKEGESQIVELPCDYSSVHEKGTTDASSEVGSSIPELVPIYTREGEFIDCPEMLEKQPKRTPGPTVSGAGQQKPTTVAMEKDVHGTAEEDNSIRQSEVTGSDLPKQDLQPGTVNEEAAMDEDLEQAGEYVEEEEEEDIPAASSCYRFYDAIDSCAALGLLKEQIYFYGHVSVKAVLGRVEMMGYRLEAPDVRTVYAARGYNAVNLTPLPASHDEASDQVAALDRVLEQLAPRFLDADLRELKETFNPKEGSVLVLLQAEDDSFLRSAIGHYLENYKLFPSCQTLAHAKSPFRRTEHLLEVEFLTPDQLPTRALPVFQPNPAWDGLELHTDNRLLVAGAKGAGKSTLCQFLVNRFVKQFGRILLIDLDIGQPVLGLPETISASVLHGPVLGVGCLAGVKPDRCLLFGSLNVVTSPVAYIEHVRTLVEHCRANRQLDGIPWIVNTMGYVSGFGEELIAAIVRLVQPTDLVQLTLPRTARINPNYEHLLEQGHVSGFRFNILRETMGDEGKKEQRQEQQHPKELHYNFHEMDVIFVQRGLALHPPKRRNLSIMAQLVRILPHGTESFTDIDPFCAPLDDLEVVIMRDEYSDAPKQMLPTVLDAMMVYLCERVSDSPHLSCLGVGIVRAVDQRRVVHLLHPLVPDELQRVRVLALCNTTLPSPIYLQLSCKLDPTTVPYLQNVG